ncbi:radical SAM protein [Actinokineospora auranticolor]|uniref:Lysine 2,3-aminomutase n=1 Tax=Actinokineospora auranticolor TaxID=155976 RepID=A0A2S6GIF6_9PSEU|nr:radical SAM protein [Actinokineospora auranticolor]PPK65018.1 lysine 2,3-aminomutase [Actinokineospora auranticolor]
MTEARFAEKTTPYLLELAERSDAVRKMYVYDPAHEDIPADIERDLLSEKANTAVPGGVRKFDGRLLVLLSYTCGANCRYCERQDRVGVGLDRLGRLGTAQIDTIVDYVKQDGELHDIIASGGDPLINPKGLEYLFTSLAEVEHVKVMRIHTRFPVQSPGQVNLDLMRKLATLRPTMYLSLHISHPDELTPEVEDLIAQFRAMGYLLICQSVFLKGVNDDVEVLYRLYTRLFQLGVRPYYLYHCQRIPTTARFEMDLRDEVAIMSRLRERLDGLAFPQHVIDMPAARGKVLVPTNHWDFDLGHVTDFDGLTLSTETWKARED